MKCYTAGTDSRHRPQKATTSDTCSIACAAYSTISAVHLSGPEKAAEHFPGTDGNQTDNENTFRRAGWYETLHNKDS